MSRIDENGAGELDCMPHPDAVTHRNGGDYGVYTESTHGRNPLPFAMAEKIDNSIKAIMQLTDEGKGFRGTIKVYIIFDNEALQHIVFLDNGCGMDMVNLRSYATYAYSQEARKKDEAKDTDRRGKTDSPAPAKGASKAARRANEDDDPLVLTGNIGHFGVGAQHSVFFMGDMEQVVSRALGASDESPLVDMVISANEMDLLWDEGHKQKVYNFPILTRAAGDASKHHSLKSPKATKQLGDAQGHRVMRQLLEEENSATNKHFSRFLITGIRGELKEFLNRRPARAQQSLAKVSSWTAVDNLIADLARIYNYYLHGTDDSALVLSDSEPSSDDDDEDEGAPAPSSQVRAGGAGSKRKDWKGIAASVTGKRQKGEAGRVEKGRSEGLWKNIDLKLFVEGPNGLMQEPCDLRDERNNVEYRMRRKKKDVFEFNLELPNKDDKANMHKVTVRLYYFPKLMEKETRPLDDGEDHDDQYKERPIISCYWEGRWIPYARVRTLPIFKNIAEDVQHRHLLGRLRGSVFFPHEYIPSKNKLDFQVSPEASLNNDGVRVMKHRKWHDDEERAVRNDFTNWLKKCHENYDMDVKFDMEGNREPSYNSQEDRTYYDKLTYGHVVYKLHQNITIQKGKPHIFGEITRIWREGKHSEDATSSGFVTIKRYPLEVFGLEEDGNSYSFPVSRLSCERGTTQDAAEQSRWKQSVDRLKNMVPFEILVTEGRTDERDEKLATGTLRAKPKTRDNCREIKNTDQHEVAGFKTMAYDVVILNRMGKAVRDDVMLSQKLSADRDTAPRAGGVGSRQRKSIGVRCVITRKRVDDVETFGHLQPTVYDQTQHSQSKDLSYEFPGIIECFDVAGEYELMFKVVGADLYDPKECKIQPIEWKQKFIISASSPGKLYIPSEAEGAMSRPPILQMGCAMSAAVNLRFRDAFGIELPAEDERTGNLCPVPKSLAIEFQDVKPDGFRITAELETRVRDIHTASWSIKIEPENREVEALMRLQKKGGRQLDLECTLAVNVMSAKRKKESDETVRNVLKYHKFKFLLQAGAPKELRLVNGASGAGDALQVENGEKMPLLEVQVQDKWGCLVVQYRGEALKVQEQLVYKGDGEEIKARKLSPDTFKEFLRDVTDKKAVAQLGDRRIVLRAPQVRAPEDHQLVCTLVTAKGEPLPQSLKIQNNPLSVPVCVKPSKKPHDVVVWLKDEQVEASKDKLENPVPTTAGTEQEDVKFEILDEASRRVVLGKKDGWTVSGGGWGKVEVPCVCNKLGFVVMPKLTARTKAGDASEHAIMFQGPFGDAGERPHISVSINLLPVPGTPREWVFFDVDDKGKFKRFDRTRLLALKNGQPLRNKGCVRLEDGHGNIVSLGKYQSEVRPFALTSGNPTQDDKNQLQKEGDWSSLQYDKECDAFRFAPTACIKGLCGPNKVELRISTANDVDSKWKSAIKPQSILLRLTAGQPFRVRLYMKGHPVPSEVMDGFDGGLRERDNKTFATEVTDTTVFERWPAVGKVDEVLVEIVDEAGNLVEGGLENARSDLVLLDGKLCVKGGSATEEQLEARVSSKGQCKWKNVFFRGEPDKTLTLKARARIPKYPDVLEAVAKITFQRANIAERIVLDRAKVPELAKPGDCVCLRASIETQDGQMYAGEMTKALKCSLTGPGTSAQIFKILQPQLEVVREDEICLHNSFMRNCEICKVRPLQSAGQGQDKELGSQPFGNGKEWLAWKVDPNDIQRAGSYTLRIQFEETRPGMQDLAAQLPVVQEVVTSFSVCPGSAWNVEIRKFDERGRNQNVLVSNAQGDNNLASALSLQLLDAFRNEIGAAPEEFQVAAYIAHPRAEARRKGTKEVCAEVDFFFVNDAQRREKLQEAHQKLVRLKEERDQLDKDEKAIKQMRDRHFEHLQNAARSLSQAAQNAYRMRALPEDIQINELLEAQKLPDSIDIKSFNDMKETTVQKLLGVMDMIRAKRNASERIQGVSRSIEEEVADMQRTFGRENVLGCFGQLITVDDPIIAHMMACWKNPDLCTILVTDRQTQVKCTTHSKANGGNLEIMSVHDCERINRHPRTYRNVQNKERVLFSGLDHNTSRLFADLSEDMVLNKIEFKNPQHEHLRFSVARQFFGNTIIVPHSLGECLNRRQSFLQHNLRPPDMWSIKDMSKCTALGKSGGNANRMRPLRDIERMMRTGRVILVPGPDESQPKIDALQALQKDIDTFAKKTEHCFTFHLPNSKWTSERPKWLMRLQDLDECIKDVESGISTLENRASVPMGTGTSSSASIPPALANEQQISADHVLRIEYGALGGVVLADMDDRGHACLRDLRLNPCIGTTDSAFVLRMVVVQKRDLTPLLRRPAARATGEDGMPAVAANGEFLEIPDIWPRG